MRLPRASRPGAATPRQTALSPYEQIADLLRASIENGELLPGDNIPTVDQVAATNRVSPGTAQRALALLRAQGLIRAHRGRRSVVG